MKFKFLLFTLILLNCTTHNWPRNDFYDFFISFSTRDIKYRSFDTKTKTIACCDSTILNSILKKTISEHEELVRIGRRNYAFSKGVYIEFDKELLYSQFISAYKSCGYLSHESDIPLSFGSFGLKTNYYCFNCRSELWEYRPMIQFQYDSIIVFSSLAPKKTYNNNQYKQAAKTIDSLMIMAEYIEYKIAENSGYSKDDQLIRICATDSVRLDKIINVLSNIQNWSKYIYKFYLYDELDKKNLSYHESDNVKQHFCSVTLDSILMISDKSGHDIEQIKNFINRELIALRYSYSKLIKTGQGFTGTYIIKVYLLSCGKIKTVKILKEAIKDSDFSQIICQKFQKMNFSSVCDTNGISEFDCYLKFDIY